MSEVFEPYIEMWRNWKDFDGFCDVSEYWIPQVINIGILIILLILLNVWIWFALLFFIYTIAITIPMFSLMVRRFHDTNRSGWYWTWGFIPVVGEIVVLIALFDSGR